MGKCFNELTSSVKQRSSSTLLQSVLITTVVITTSFVLTINRYFYTILSILVQLNIVPGGGGGLVTRLGAGSGGRTTSRIPKMGLGLQIMWQGASRYGRYKSLTLVQLDDADHELCYCSYVPWNSLQAQYTPSCPTCIATTPHLWRWLVTLPPLVPFLMMTTQNCTEECAQPPWLLPTKRVHLPQRMSPMIKSKWCQLVTS